MATLKQILCREYNWLLAQVKMAKIHTKRPMPAAVDEQVARVNRELNHLDRMLRQDLIRQFYYVKNGAPAKWPSN